MSATNRSNVRRENDFYETPQELCDLILERFTSKITPSSILDPGCGTGNFADAARRTYPHATVVGIDKDPNVLDVASKRGLYVTQSDIQDWSGRYSLIVGNPPYNQAATFIKTCLNMLTPVGYVAFLLRLNFLESQKRYAGLFKDHPPSEIWVLPARPSFTKGGTDATSYGIFLWKKVPPTITTLEWLDNRHIKNK